jgi:hypothetical protein
VKLGEDGAINVPLQFTDHLAHTDIAGSLIRHLSYLPRGSVIAIQGNWGRGKTDILARVNSILADQTPAPAWINPWQYGAPDLLSPLVLELVNRVGPEKRRNSDLMRSAVKTLLRVGNAIAIQGASLVVPVVGPLMTSAAAPIDDFIKSVFDESGPETPYDSVKVMADAFRQLVDQYQILTNSGDRQLVILVDDLDRCLPDHQIAVLESIHFLTSAGANCHFLIAIDPQLVAQAAISHYKVRSFDTEQFLDKLFDLRVTLQYLRSEQTLPLFRALLADMEDPDQISTAEMKRLTAAFPNVFIVPAVNNPRVMTRVARRIQLLLVETESRRWLESTLDTHALLSWACICERWPSLRIVFQILNTRTIDPDSLYEIVVGIGDRFSGKSGAQDVRQSRRPIMERLPPVESEPDLGIFLTNSLENGAEMVKRWLLLDAEMCHAAL